MNSIFENLVLKKLKLHSASIKLHYTSVFGKGWSLTFSIFAVVKAGIMNGIKNIRYTKRFELKPFATKFDLSLF